METIKQEYKVLNQEVWAYYFQLYVTFEHNGKVYTAQGQYINGGWGIDDIEVYDEDREEVYDEELMEIGEKLINELEINDKTITW